MLYNVMFVVAWLNIWTTMVYCHDILVKTPLGDVSGFKMSTRGGREIAAYTSIPFAVPPIGELRFKPAVPISPWKRILDATKEVPLCIQRNPYIHEKDIVGQEDCLYLNVYTPKIPGKHTVDELLPVMVFFHGGGWMCGDSRTVMYGPEYLLDRDVVYVATNYRLGPLGFLSTQDKHCPGNNGLKDQQEALRWIQNNIHSFGGDKHSVTLFGESAGGASVHYHMLSHTSAGLFHKAISQSGTALVPWAEAPPGESSRNALRLAKLLDCPPAPSERLIKCLRAKDAFDIINTEYSFYEWDYDPMTPFKAVVEPDSPGAFLVKEPRQVTDVPSVPWMTGLVKDEGCLKSIWITANFSKFDEFSSAFDTIAPITFYYENSADVNFITRVLREKYLNGRKGALTDKEIDGILKMFTDSYFAYPVIEAVDLTFKYTKHPIYLYELTYRANNSFSQIFGDPEGDYGVCHADDLMHLFPIHFLHNDFSEKDKQISELIVTLWTNFATSGDPNKPLDIPTKWEPLSDPNKMENLNIGHDLKMTENLGARSRLWGTLPLWHKKYTRLFDDEL